MQIKVNGDVHSNVEDAEKLIDNVDLEHETVDDEPVVMNNSISTEPYQAQ